MRRKQLYAIILAGALAASSAPAAVFAAEGDVAATAETSEENPVDGETAAATRSTGRRNTGRYYSSYRGTGRTGTGAGKLQQLQRHRRRKQHRQSRHSRLQKRHRLYRKHLRQRLVKQQKPKAKQKSLLQVRQQSRQQSRLH